MRIGMFSFIKMSVILLLSRVCVLFCDAEFSAFVAGEGYVVLLFEFF